MHLLLFAWMIIGRMAFLVRSSLIRTIVYKCQPLITESLWSFVVLTDDCHNHPTAELSKSQKEEIQSSKRISNPGCYPTGFIALIRPLVDAGIVPADAPLTVNAISGYSGGGNALIGIFESDEHEPWGAYGYSMVRMACNLLETTRHSYYDISRILYSIL